MNSWYCWRRLFILYFLVSRCNNLTHQGENVGGALLTNFSFKSTILNKTICEMRKKGRHLETLQSNQVDSQDADSGKPPFLTTYAALKIQGCPPCRSLSLLQQSLTKETLTPIQSGWPRKQANQWSSTDMQQLQIKDPHLLPDLVLLLPPNCYHSNWGQVHLTAQPMARPKTT